MSVSMGTNDLSYSSCESFPGRLCPCPCVQVYFCIVWHTRVYYFVVSCHVMVYYGRSPVVCTHVLMSKCSFPSPSFVQTSKVTTFRPMFRQMFKSMFKLAFKPMFKAVLWNQFIINILSLVYLSCHITGHKAKRMSLKGVPAVLLNQVQLKTLIPIQGNISEQHQLNALRNFCSVSCKSTIHLANSGLGQP